jgi:ankyrin repeat protein
MSSSARYFVMTSNRFRWVFCQLEALRHCLPPSVRHILAKLPKSLDETYERILQEIPKVNQVHTHRLLQCLTVAVRPLTVEELAEVFAIDFPVAGGIPKLNESSRCEDQEQAVLSACSSLITIVEDKGSRRVHFSHFSVKEFLTSDRLAGKTVDASHYHIRLHSAYTIMAQVCLAALLRFDDQMDEKTIKSYPLAEYAGQHFTDHADSEDVLKDINDDGLDRLFDPDKPHFDIWWRLRSVDQAGDNSHDVPSICQTSSESSLDSKQSSPDPDYSGASPLKPGHPLSTHSEGLTPMHCIVRLGHFFLAQHLISKRLQDHNVLYKGMTLSHFALYMNNFKISRLALRHCVDVDIRGIKGWTALHIVASTGRLELTRILLERRAAVDPQDNKRRTPLYCAMYRAEDESEDESEYETEDKPDVLGCARLLLDHGADVDARNNCGQAPLHQATSREVIGAVRLLIERGAFVDLADDKGETALHRASRRGNVDITRLLISQGASVDAQDNGGSTPLHLAASSEDNKVPKLLLEHGANVNVQNKEGKTPFQVASVSVKDLLSEHMQSVHEA